ncbi:hypothetical protein OROHE_022670 [Orobanche hederae]
MANHHTNSQHPLAVVIVPLPVQGHMNQLLNLSRLLSARNLPVYFLGTTALICQAKTRVHGWDPSSVSMHFHEFPTPVFINHPPNPYTSSKFPVHLVQPVMATALNLRQPVYEFINNKLSMEFNKIIVIYDFFMSYVVQDVGSVKNVEAYRFQCSSAFTSFSFHWKNQNEPPVPPEAIEVLNECPPEESSIAPEFSDMIMQLNTPINFFGDIYDACRVVEPLYIELIEKRKLLGAQQIWALGPLNHISLPVNPDTGTQHECLKWLDKHEPDSVILISFGTTVTFTDEEIMEIGMGLEKSHQKFIWVLRDADRGDVSTNAIREASDIFPLGFEDRIKEKGLILTGWAPQLEILAHNATGGFMSHCGWNSCSESITMGVPIATWPMHLDQPRNTVLITKGLKVGVEVVHWECRNEKVSSDIVEKGVRKLMASDEGEKIRKRAKELAACVRESFMEGGIARKEFDSFIAHIMK